MKMNEINVNRLKDFKKKQLFSEFKMLGINEGIVYPDFSYKSSAVNDWYQ